MALYDPAAHEPLTATPWDAGRARAAVARIVTQRQSLELTSVVAYPSGLAQLRYVPKREAG